MARTRCPRPAATASTIFTARIGQRHARKKTDAEAKLFRKVKSQPAKVCLHGARYDREPVRSRLTDTILVPSAARRKRCRSKPKRRIRFHPSPKLNSLGLRPRRPEFRDCALRRLGGIEVAKVVRVDMGQRSGATHKTDAVAADGLAIGLASRRLTPSIDHRHIH